MLFEYDIMLSSVPLYKVLSVSKTSKVIPPSENIKSDKHKTEGIKNNDLAPANDLLVGGLVRIETIIKIMPV